jgi:hypothetical protein
VQDVLPQGSTWDGTSDLPMDEASFKQMFSEIEPNADAPAAAAPATATPGSPAPGSAAVTRGKTPPPPKDGS